MNIQKALQTQNLLLQSVSLEFKRSLHARINYPQRLLGIVGPRGVGKTTMLLQYLKEQKEQKFLYIIADTILFKTGDLLGLAEQFYFKHQGRLLCLDEIHRFPNWNQELKNIYDSFPDLHVIISGSSSIDLIRGKYDLSRRAILYQLEGLSFREFLQLEYKLDIPPFTLEEIISNHGAIVSAHIPLQDILFYFKQYLDFGYYPFYLENRQKELYYQKILQTLDKAVYEDIASIYHLKTENLLVFKQIIHFLATISPGEVNIHKIAQNVHKNYETVANYIQILHDASLLRMLSADKTGYALIRSAQKVFLDNPNLLSAICENLGMSSQTGLNRELFALNQLQAAGYRPVCPLVGDLLIDNYYIEIGGKTKTDKQIRNQNQRVVFADDITIGIGNTIPLYLLGFLY